MEGGDSTQLLSTFSTDIGEVALQPSTGGTFVVTLYHAGKEGVKDENGEVKIQTHVIWNRKVEGGFPETKELKKRILHEIWDMLMPINPLPQPQTPLPHRHSQQHRHKNRKKYSTAAAKSLSRAKKAGSGIVDPGMRTVDFRVGEGEMLRGAGNW
ncbi:selT selW selH seleno domain-containing protein [Rutstroemia sp. NJR-2017a BBW]|nr:selT selW selH seleno domain-containing protein [Rutstroemia sp. NJR-2017a BBW]